MTNATSNTNTNTNTNDDGGHDEKLALKFLLASLITSYPDEQFPLLLRKLLEDTGLAIPTNLRALLVASFKSLARLEELRSEYIDLFDRGRAANPLYETEYGRDRALVKGNELADIAGFYKAFGLGIGIGIGIGASGTSLEMLDHVAVELEFYSLLLLKSQALGQTRDFEGSDIVMDARKKFLTDHLGRFVTAISNRPGVQASSYFSAVFGWCRDLVKNECETLSVQPLQADWVSDSKIHSDLEREPSCGAFGGCAQESPSASC